MYSTKVSEENQGTMEMGYPLKLFDTKSQEHLNSIYIYIC